MYSLDPHCIVKLLLPHSCKSVFVINWPVFKKKKKKNEASATESKYNVLIV